MRKLLISLLLCLVTTTAYAQCETTVDGYCRLDFDIMEGQGLPSSPSVSELGTARIYFDSTLGKLRCSQDGDAYTDCVGGGSGSLNNIVEDTTPQLGGDLDAQNYDITSVAVIGAGTVTVDPETYGVGWSADSSVPTKDDIYDKIETMTSSGGGTTDGAGTVYVSVDTDDFCVGGNTSTNCEFYIDQSAGTAKTTNSFIVGSNTTANITWMVIDAFGSDISLVYDYANSKLVFPVAAEFQGTGATVLDYGVVANNNQGATSEYDSILYGDSRAVLTIDASNNEMIVLGTVTMTNVVSIDYLNNSILEADLKVVNTAVDEDIFTYESTTGDFEWHTASELNLYSVGGTDVALADGGTGTSLSDPNDDRALFWDDSHGQIRFLDIGSGLSVSGVTVTATGSGTGDITGVGDCSTGECFNASGTGNELVFEGLTADSNELTLTVEDPGFDVTVAIIATTGYIHPINDEFVISDDVLTFYDVSSNRVEWLRLGTGLAITAHTINNTIDDLDDLNLTSLADPNEDRIVFWDDSDGRHEFLVIGSNLSISGNTISATAGGGGDSIFVDGSASTDAYFVSTGDIDFVLSSNTISANINANVVSADELNATGVEAELEAVLDLNELQGAVTDGQVPNTITIDLATTATTANAGDSATAFFPSGTIELGVGGTGKSLSDPNADRVFFWDDSHGQTDWMVLSTGLSVSGKTVTVDLGTSISASEIADGDHGDFTYASGTATLDTDSVSSNELNATGVEAELEAVIDLEDLQGTLTLAKGGTGVGLVDPNADRIYFWDDSDGRTEFLVVGSGLTVSGNTITASAGSGDITGVGDCTSDECFNTSGTGNSLVFEGSTADSNELTLTVEDPGVDVTLTLIATTGNLYPIVEEFTVSQDVLQFYDISDNRNEFLRLGTGLSISAHTINVSDNYLLNSTSDTMTGTLTADGITLGGGELITLGSNTIEHNGTDFLFDDNVRAVSFTEGAIAVLNNDEIDASSELAAIMDDETGTGALVFGTDPVFTTSVQIPNGTAPTVNAAGEIAVDTTDDQLIYYGGAKRVIAYILEECKTIETPVDADDNITLFAWRDASTITDVWCETQGSSTPSISMTLSDGTNALEAITCSDAGQEDDGSIANGTFTSLERVEVDFGAPSGTVNWVTICVTRTVDAQ